MKPESSIHRYYLQLFYAFGLVFLLGLILSPFWMPILMAAIFALGIEPVLKKLGEKLNLKLKVTAWAYLISLFFFIFVPITIFVLRSIDGVKKWSEQGFSSTEFYASILDIKARILAMIASTEKKFNFEISDQLEIWGNDFIDWLSQFLIQVSGQIATSFPQFLMSFTIFLITLYIFLKQKSAIRIFLYKSGVLNISALRQIIQITQNACASTLIASLTTGFIQASLVATAALIFRAGDFWIVFLATFFTSFIPAIGAGPVCFLLAVPFLLRGEYFPGGSLVAFAFFTGTVDNIIRPYLVSSGESLHPFFLFLATIGAILIFGLPGLFIGPVIAIMTVKIFPLLIQG